MHIPNMETNHDDAESKAKKKVGRPKLSDESRRKVVCVMLAPASIATLVSEARKRDVAIGRVIDKMCEDYAAKK